MALPLLSVIVVSFRSQEEIGGCLESIPAQLSHGAVEVLVVDNASGDGTVELVRSRFPCVTVLEPGENLGFGRANNLGYRSAQGKFVLFLNPDTVCNRVALEHCLGRLRDEPELGLITPKLIQQDGSMDLACRRSIPTLWDGFCRASGLSAAFPRRRILAGYNLTHLPEEATYDVGAINGAFMMARREVLEEVGVFDERFFMYGDDLDLCIRVGKAGYRVVYDGRVQITHLKGMSVSKEFERMSAALFDANRDVYLKHFNPRGSRWVRWKYQLAFGAWKRISAWRAARRGYRRVRPL